jgi:hypothetical protein
MEGNHFAPRVFRSTQKAINVLMDAVVYKDEESARFLIEEGESLDESYVLIQQLTLSFIDISLSY